MICCHFDNIENKIVEYMSKADKIQICSAWCSSRPIIDILSNIDSTLIVTYQNKFIQGSKDFNMFEFDLIKKSVLRFYMFKHNENIMHIKYIILFRDDIPYAVITGSYNFTINAINNCENILYIENINIAKQYSENFNHLLKNCKKI